MAGWLSITDTLNVLERAAGFLASIARADWSGASARGGAAGVAGEALRTLAGTNTWTFRIPREAGWNGASIERFLWHYGVRIWDRGVRDTELHFTVERRQANWAEYLLLRRGIPILGPLVNQRNVAYGQRHQPGDRPPAWGDRKSPASVVDRFIDLF